MRSLLWIRGKLLVKKKKKKSNTETRKRLPLYYSDYPKHAKAERHREIFIFKREADELTSTRNVFFKSMVVNGTSNEKYN